MIMQFAFDMHGEVATLAQEVDALQTVSGGPWGYRLRRIILAHFWLYGIQEFEIPHGRLFLAGENASGKSTVLTTAIPLALEGNLRSNRLDTFGGRHKHVEYYVLGDETSSAYLKYDKRTSYIALEFEWCTSDISASEASTEKPLLQQSNHLDKARYLTIGLSLYGNETAATRIQPVYFLITDGSRLVHNVNGSPRPHTIELTYTENNKIHTFSQHVFREKLKGHGIICKSQENYAEEVSRRLFGFDEPSKFHKLIELLLVLRRPNPSDELTLNSVQQHLTDSLPSIPISTTKDVAETIIEINDLKRQIEQLEQEYQAISDLHAAQQMLALSAARIAGNTYIHSQQQVEHLEALIRDLYLRISE